MILSTSWSPDTWRDKSSGAKRLCFLSEPHHPPSDRHWGLKFAIDVIVLSQQGCLMLSLTINVYDWGELQLTTCFFATQAWSFVINDFLERSSLLETIKVPPLVNDPCRRFWQQWWYVDLSLLLPLFVQLCLSEPCKHFSDSILSLLSCTDHNAPLLQCQRGDGKRCDAGVPCRPGRPPRRAQVPRQRVRRRPLRSSPRRNGAHSCCGSDGLSALHQVDGSWTGGRAVKNLKSIRLQGCGREHPRWRRSHASSLCRQQRPHWDRELIDILQYQFRTHNQIELNQNQTYYSLELQVKWLLRRGAKISHDKYGKTPMNDAAENEQLEVRQLHWQCQIQLRGYEQ